MTNFLIENWQAIIGIIGIAGAWFGGKKHLLNNQVRQTQAEVTGTNIENVTATLEVYKGALDDLEIRFKNRIADLEDDLEKMQVLNNELRKVIAGNERYIKKLQSKLEKYEKLEE
jgi:vacuolar-type H+-ATPase subunit I/STV1